MAAPHAQKLHLRLTHIILPSQSIRQRWNFKGLQLEHTLVIILSVITYHYCTDYSRFPAIDFFEPPIKKCITSKRDFIKLDDIGLSITVPEHSLGQDENIDLLIRPCSNGPFKFPDGYKQASPAYIIEPSKKGVIRKKITLQIQHFISLMTEEDCEGMVFLSASTKPQIGKSGPMYTFKEIKGSKGRFGPMSQIGKITLEHFCCITTGRDATSGMFPCHAFVAT